MYPLSKKPFRTTIRKGFLVLGKKKYKIHFPIYEVHKE